MNVGLISLPKSAASFLNSMAQDQGRKEEVFGTISLEDRYCGEVLTS